MAALWRRWPGRRPGRPDLRPGHVAALTLRTARTARNLARTDSGPDGLVFWNLSFARHSLDGLVAITAVDPDGHVPRTALTARTPLHFGADSPDGLDGAVRAGQHLVIGEFLSSLCQSLHGRESAGHARTQSHTHEYSFWSSFVVFLLSFQLYMKPASA